LLAEAEPTTVRIESDVAVSVRWESGGTGPIRTVSVGSRFERAELGCNGGVLEVGIPVHRARLRWSDAPDAAVLLDGPGLDTAADSGRRLQVFGRPDSQVALLLRSPTGQAVETVSSELRLNGAGVAAVNGGQLREALRASPIRLGRFVLQDDRSDAAGNRLGGGHQHPGGGGLPPQRIRRPDAGGAAGRPRRRTGPPPAEPGRRPARRGGRSSEPRAGRTGRPAAVRRRCPGSGAAGPKIGGGRRFVGRPPSRCRCPPAGR
jgi:hypothetical protein